ncbi:PTS sugar transporter subunit IIA [Lacticaseibacillus zeae]|uniref:PTS sugar transporter subunit IIA n=1 Tax=Lacticaseibacillus zeae subsp. silagei TaxID=3068307 RepID=A0ABD7ZA65_LACZE|nr:MULTISPECIES: PTS sugar transporter subunit IIA [Lacticaseibacillus]MDE3314443.1 PTS sugar transporter subunit IIA [Lacticaseibacillus zeae]OFR98975.1 PTS glucose transporter subunit IIABC [Lactobacillus sp. HMSC068F07]WLV84070.1 PTS sugar transporter subunit IIA [Lacticaseibacillus sp. NCIMB 15475]WLV86825.1 PTS sugar transporter subunit IIA [Lacticaseibacillus sp. NCIMB 15474]
MFFDEEIMTLHSDASDATAIMTKLAQQLRAKNMVTDQFLPHVLAREKEYPTGLATGSIGVAIPHTDSIYVNKSQIAFASLTKPVTFRSMVDLNQTIKVSMVFMIAMSTPHEQTDLLSNLMNMFQNQNVLYKLNQSDTKKQVITILNSNNIL